MFSRCCSILLVLLVLPGILLAQAPGLPLFSPTPSTPQRFFVEGDEEWASVKFQGNSNADYDRTFIPSLSAGWKLAEEQIFYANYRFLGADVEDRFNVGVPDLESSLKQRIRLNSFDIMYRETLGGDRMPLGLSVDMGTRFAWAYMNDWREQLTIAGSTMDHRQLNFYVGGGRFGLRPYWMFDESSWQMTIYGQASFSYLWGQFREEGRFHPQTVDQPNIDRKSWNTLWNLDLEAGLSSYVPGFEGILKLTAGYRYEMWSSDRFRFLGEGADKLTVQGPFIRLQFSF
ncbi:MAG TPA: hypothetical protein PKA06_01965 [Gemmatales bacterium]|nr:hypothetical protein [Gemmatales bacterium]